MRIRLQHTLVALALVLPLTNTHAQKSDQLKKLYDNHDWFQLRQLVRSRNASTFYRGVVAAVSNDVVSAERYLFPVLNSSPASVEAIDAYSLLTQTYMRVGRYRDALAMVEKALKLKPDDEGFKNVHRLLGALGKYSEQSVSSRHSSRVHYTIRDGNLFVPVKVNGQSATALVDTGANFSLISAEEAKRLGLSIRDGAGATLSDSAGTSVDFRLAVAEKFTLGEIELRNTVFFVMRDDQQPFVDLPIGERVIIGMPILLALRSFRFDHRGNFDVGLSIGARRSANMYFEGSEAIFEGEFRRQRIKIFLDSGATRTRVLRRFAKEFRSFVDEKGTRSSDRITGVGSSMELESKLLPEVKFRVTGTELVLRSAQVVLADSAVNSRWYHVWMGMDLLSQPRSVTINFREMRIDFN